MTASARYGRPVTLAIDHASVLCAASAVTGLAGALDGAPGGGALRLVAASLPGGELAAAAATQAGEWAGEMSELGAAFARWATALESAVAQHRAQDATGVAALSCPP